jgi:hypothetical protein
MAFKVALEGRISDAGQGHDPKVNRPKIVFARLSQVRHRPSMAGSSFDRSN